MGKISSYPSDANVTTSDRLIGSDNENANETKNFEVGDIITLAASIIIPQVGGNFVPYTGATANVDLGNYDLIADNVQADIFQLNSSGILGLYGTVQLNGSPGIAGQVLTSSGGGVPTWTTPLSTSGFVPYTGATANVDLGTYTLISDVVTSNITLNLNGEVRVNGNPGNLGDIFISGGAGTYPTWQPISTVVQLPYLSAYSALQQTATLANTGYAMNFNTVDISNNISVANNGALNPTRITPTESGIYNIQFSAQIQRSTGGASATIDIWFRQGGVDIPNSNTSVNVQANAGFLVASWNFFTFIDVEAINPYVEIIWATTDTNVSLQQQASNAVHPATPSVIVTVNKVSN